jgi:hypothetical protein
MEFSAVLWMLGSLFPSCLPTSAKDMRLSTHLTFSLDDFNYAHSLLPGVWSIVCFFGKQLFLK